MADLDRLMRTHNAGMVAFDLALGVGSLLAPEKVLRMVGHDPPAPEAAELWRRNAPLWLTFAAGHLMAAVRGEPRDWYALAWLRGAEIATDALWASRSPALARPGARAGLWFAGASNLAMALGFRKLARR